MDNTPHTRFSETPPDSPKSCMKGSRRINFADQSEEKPSGQPVASASPKKSTKTVCIRSPGSSTVGQSTSSETTTTTATVQKRPAEIEFQFNLTQHYEQSTPPPNCTSNGDSHHEETTSSASASAEPDTSVDPKQDPQLMEIASKFVNEIIERAKLEAANREKADGGKDAKPNPTSFRAVAEDFLAGRTPWYRRAHGAISKWITNLCVRAQNSIRT